MKKIFVFILVSMCITSLPQNTSAESSNTTLRTWKTLNGNTVQAKYIETKYGHVKLQTADGKFVAVTVKSLCTEDRQWIKTNETTKNTPILIEAPASSNKLPVASDDDYKNLYAVYTAKNFEAQMQANGIIYVYLKENGKRMNKPIRLYMHNYYYNEYGQHTRTLISFDQPPKPPLIKQPKILTFTGMLKSNVSFSVTYEFSEKGIRGYGYCKDPKSVTNTTYYRIRADIPASHTFPKEMSRMELNQQMIGWQVITIPLKGKQLAWPYEKPTKNIHKISKKLIIDAPMYGERNISFKAGDTKDAPLRPYIYHGNYPWQGYVVQVIKKENSKKSRKQYLEMIIK